MVEEAPIIPTPFLANIDPETTNSLKQIAEYKNITVSECIRRAVSVWSLLECEKEQGHKVLLVDDVQTRQLVLLP